MTNIVTAEPVRAAVIALITAGIGLLVAFGVDFTTEQTAAVLAFATAALGIGELVRARVTPIRRKA